MLLQLTRSVRGASNSGDFLGFFLRVFRIVFDAGQFDVCDRLGIPFSTFDLDPPVGVNVKGEFFWKDREFIKKFFTCNDHDFVSGSVLAQGRVFQDHKVEDLV